MGKHELAPGDTSGLIFGREPAAVVGLIEAALVLATAIGLDWSTTQVALVSACASALLGVYVAFATHDTLLAAVVAGTKAVLALLIGFGVPVSAELVAAIIGFISVALALFNRTQTFPSADPPKALPGATAVSEVGTAA